MVLSRFWLIIFISSIVFVVASLFTSNHYSIDYMLNGKKDDPVLVGEKYLNQLPVAIQDSLKASSEGTYVIANTDSMFVMKNKTVTIYNGFQKSDGLLETCKTSLFDLILPLIAYLAFFSGIMQLLIDSGATERL
ncbi:MAG: hypothetical protein RLZ33_584, partial [Bacteroidota bacterium]